MSISLLTLHHDGVLMHYRPDFSDFCMRCGHRLNNNLMIVHFIIKSMVAADLPYFYIIFVMMNIVDQISICITSSSSYCEATGYNIVGHKII